MPRIRTEVDDFLVEELPLYEPTGEGGHTFVWIEKRELDTEEVVRALARAAGVPPREIGYAGRKDRRAVARQWMSVPALDPTQALALAIPGVRVLAARRHPHKLRTGQLRGNRFAIVVRGVDAAAAERAGARLDELRRVGLPNRFGSQRFGRDADNAERGRAVLEGRLRPRDRRAARFLVSALQSEVFNEVLAARPLALDEIETGEVAQVVDSGGLFVVEDAARETARAGRFEISATGPIFGTGGRDPVPAGAAAERERAAAATLGVTDELVRNAPAGLRLRGARRPLRVSVADAAMGIDGETVRLTFSLASGSYATVLIEELFGPLEDGAPHQRGAGGPGPI